MTDSTRKMYDAITPSNMPADGDLYAGYDDGNWPDAEAIAELFPGKTIIRITTNPMNNDGVVGDGPPDNGTWPQWVGWVVKRRAAGVDPTINTNASNWTAGQSAFNQAGVAQPHWWIAKYDGDPTIMAGAVAKQYATGNFDTSSVLPYWPGVDPPPATNEEDEVPTYEKTSNPETGRAGIGFAEGACNTFQVTADKGSVPAGATFRFVIVLDSGPDVVEETQALTNGKAVVHIPSQFHGLASGIIVYGPTGLEYELYAQ